jgi:pyruvate/2-oxoglutarate dehydrogenase complex dihydrolipoamide acyltransferase (E2) component
MPARVELRLPDLDLGDVPVTASAWHVQTGQRVVEGDRLLEVLAGDATVDLAAPADGVLAARRVEIDERLTVGQVLAEIECPEA